MNNENLKDNKVEIAGEIIKELEYSHTSKNEAFYCFTVRCCRLSENCDEIPVLISEKIIDTSQKYLGKYIWVVGQIRSYMKFGGKKNGKGKLLLNVFVSDYTLSDDDLFGTINEVHLDGYTCSKPHYKETPNGFEVTEMLVAVNRQRYRRSDYIPCVCWNRSARWASGFKTGTHICINGRLQSRKIHTSGETAYEVSAHDIGLCDDDGGKDEQKCD